MAGYERIEDIAEKFTFSKGQPEKLAAMEAGETFPTFNQAKDIARKYGISEGILYMPPKLARQQIHDVGAIHDFRMGSNRLKTPELIRFLRDVLNRQELLTEIMEEDDTPDLSWIGASKGQAAGSIAQTLIHLIWQGASPALELKDWITKVEERLGVAVMQPRPYHSYSIKNQISGVAINDDKMPVVVLDITDNTQRRMFTLLHELAHLMIEAPGMSKVDSETGSIIPENQKEEKLCDTVAANALMPIQVFKASWKKQTTDKENIESLSKATGASLSACAVRAQHLGFIEGSTMKGLLTIYQKSYTAKQVQQRQYQQKRKDEGKATGYGTPPSLVARNRIGPRMTLKSLLAYDEGRISARDLYDIFGVKLKHLTKIASGVDYEMVRWRPPPDRVSNA